MIHRKLVLIFIIILLALVEIPLYGQVIGVFEDDRDSQKYETVTFKITSSADSFFHMTWMAQNLNYEVEHSFCYDDYDSNCQIMGRMYAWETAMDVCPQGWHLPSDVDWYTLVDLYGGIEKAGTHLKSNSDLWSRNGGGSNNSLFNAMPYGYGLSDGRYVSFGRNAIFWSSTAKNEIDAWDWSLVMGWIKISRSEGNKKEILNYVRCVKDVD